MAPKTQPKPTAAAAATGQAKPRNEKPAAAQAAPPSKASPDATAIALPGKKPRNAAAKDKNDTEDLPWVKRTPLWKALSIFLSFAVLCLAFAYQMSTIANEAQENSKSKPSTSRLPPWVPEDEINPSAAYRLFANASLRGPSRESFAARNLRCPAAAQEEAEDPFTGCVPRTQRCSRLVVDSFVEDRDAQELVAAMNALLRDVGGGGGSGPVSMVELHQGIVSKKDKFVSLHNALRLNKKQIFSYTTSDAEKYLAVVKKIHRTVSEYLFCSSYPCASVTEQHDARETGLRTLFVAQPSFFAKIGTKPAVTVNDEYWHMHADRVQYGSFAITTLLYLNTAASNELDTFEGGSFEFGGALPASVYPRRGRLSLFTSGAENPHWVAPVRDGVRYALTTAFTCDRAYGATLEHDGPGSFLRSLLIAVQEASLHQ